MNDITAADECGLVGPDRVRNVVQGVLRAAQANGWTDEALGEATGLSPRRIKSYRVEGREPSLSAALSLGVVLGPKAINPILALIGYHGQPLDESEREGPALAAARAMQHLGRFAVAAADNRIDHIEEPDSEEAADNVIELLVPYSSKGRAA